MVAASLKPYFGKTLVVIKDKTTNEGKRVQHLNQSILMAKTNGKNTWKDIKRLLNYNKNLLNFLLQTI